MAANKTPPFDKYPAWTTARFWGFIRSGLREKFNRYPPKYEVLSRAKRLVPILDDAGEPVLFKSGKRKGEPRTINMFKCAGCGEEFKQTEVQVDHIVPAGSLRRSDDLKTFVERLFCGVDGLQVLCSTCHNTKTQEEKKQ